MGVASLRSSGTHACTYAARTHACTYAGTYAGTYAASIHACTHAGMCDYDIRRNRCQHELNLWQLVWLHLHRSDLGLLGHRRLHLPLYGQ
jgi:hypothetical protein